MHVHTYNINRKYTRLVEEKNRDRDTIERVKFNREAVVSQG